mmetsp:Transcript_27624/g.67316  ORF Transcript_27624/g.67316 Transcript_27624/m.67316 type:complete len:216 (+) Transcript_27624:1203-1850(+)
MLWMLRACMPSIKEFFRARAASGRPVHASPDPSEFGWKKVRFADSILGHCLVSQSTATTYHKWGTLPIMFLYAGTPSPAFVTTALAIPLISSHERFLMEDPQNLCQLLSSSSNRKMVRGPGASAAFWTENVMRGSLCSGSASSSAVVGATQKLETVRSVSASARHQPSNVDLKGRAERGWEHQVPAEERGLLTKADRAVALSHCVLGKRDGGRWA